MNKRTVGACMAIILVIAAGGYYMFYTQSQNDKAVLPLHVMGDVQAPLRVDSLDDIDIDSETLEVGDRVVHAVPLQEVVAEVKPTGFDPSLLLVGHDGRAALMCSTDLSGSYIGVSEQYGWEAVNFNHPRSSNIKQLSEVVIVAERSHKYAGFGVIDTASALLETSAGDLYRQGYLHAFEEVGSSTQHHEGNELQVTAFNRQTIPDIEGLLGGQLDFDGAVVVGRRGEIEQFGRLDEFRLGPNSVSYHADGEVLIEDVAGVVLDPPERRITDVYHDSLKLMQEGEQVLAILVDGLGYHQYLYAIEHGHAPFLSTLPEAEKAMVAYPPITPVNMAASLTGETPDVSGMYRREHRSPQVPTIFGEAEERGYKSTIIIGPIQTIDFEIDPVMCVDRNADGSTDDEILEAALKRSQQDYDLLVVHFKDVDKAGHTHGDLAAETMQQIAETDGYLEQLLAAWDGHVIIFSDHGMHPTEEGGDHGRLVPEDMFVPYWLLDGEDSDE